MHYIWTREIDIDILDVQKIHHVEAALSNTEY